LGGGREEEGGQLGGRWEVGGRRRVVDGRRAEGGTEADARKTGGDWEQHLKFGSVWRWDGRVFWIGFSML